MRRNVVVAAFVALLLFSTRGVAQTIIPSINQGGVLNAASLGADTVNVAAPGSLITIFGSNMATGNATASTTPLPLNLNGTVVQIGSFFAPLLFVSPTQINAEVPVDILPGTVLVAVWVNNQRSELVSVQVRAAAPGIFTQGQIGVGPARVLHADNTLVTGSSPATPGEEVQIIATGLGATLGTQILPALQSGQPGNGQPTLAVPGVTIGKVTASVTSSAATANVGQDIIKAIVPTVAAGEQSLSITISGATTAANVTISVGGAGPSIPAGGGTPGGGGTGVTGNGPLIYSGGIINAASLDPASSDTAAPGGLISIFGNNLAPTTTGASGAPFPFSLSGVTVKVGTVSAPLLLVSPSQINAQVPLELQPGTTAQVTVIVNGQSSTPEPLNIVPAAPGVFTLAGNGSGTASIFHGTDGSPVTGNSPALPGEEVIILTTGMGATIATSNQPATVTGQPAIGQLTVNTPTVSMGGKDARVTSAVAASGQVGQYLVRAVVPDIPAGDQGVTVTAAGVTSRAASFRIGFLFNQPPAFLQANLAGNFNASFAMTVDIPGDPTHTEVAVFSKIVGNNGCTISIAGNSGPNYTGLVHCQDYSDPNNLVAVIVGLKNGQFADNKLVFTTILDTGINHFFFIGTGTAPSCPSLTPCYGLVADAPITAAAISIDLKRPDFAAGDVVVGTLDVALKLEGSSTIPSQTIILGGGFKDAITFVQR